jgi:hypothetical protein
MAGLVPAIHVFAAAQGREDVDARDDPRIKSGDGHDGGECDSIRTKPALAERRHQRRWLVECGKTLLRGDRINLKVVFLLQHRIRYICILKIGFMLGRIPPSSTGVR